MSVDDSNRLGTRQEVADFLGVPKRTLDQWAARARGPRFIKVGKHARYRWSDVEAWLEANASTPRPAA